MTVDDMVAHANRRLAEGAEDMLLTLVRSRDPRGETVRLFGAGSPVGHISGTFENGDGRVRVAAFFKCNDVLTFIAELKVEHVLQKEHSEVPK